MVNAILFTLFGPNTILKSEKWTANPFYCSACSQFINPKQWTQITVPNPFHPWIVKWYYSLSDPVFARNPNLTLYTLFDRFEVVNPNLNSVQSKQAPDKSPPPHTTTFLYDSLSIYNIFVVLGSISQLRSIQFNTNNYPSSTPPSLSFFSVLFTCMLFPAHSLLS